MTIKILQIDAFADRPFAGNPAAVCVLPGPADDRWMQDVAREMNLSETAFLHKISDGNAYHLRWFTPVLEVDLCGHATLASAHALWENGEIDASEPLRFQTRSGWLSANRNASLIELDFPSCPTQKVDPPTEVSEALGAAIIASETNRMDLLIEVESDALVRSLSPDFGRLKALTTDYRGIIVTARCDDDRFDFVSRFFAPNCGVDEDPVTGSAHCALSPFWSSRLGKTTLTGYQASPRGGTVHTTLAGDRVILGGLAVTVLRGELLHSPF